MSADSSNSSKVILATKALTKRFPGVLALDQVSFDLRPGEVHALCGENGAGKSTLIKTLSGIWPYGSYEGEIHLQGQKAKFRSIGDAEAAGLAVIYQELALVGELTVAENIFLGDEPTRAGLIDWNRIYHESSQLLTKFGLDLDPAARISDLGTGKQQLVEIVKALRKNGNILILDEPTAALTEQEVDVLLDIIRDLREGGMTCVYISHKLDEVFAISDRITVLRDGKSITTLTTSEVDQAEVIRQMVGRDIDDLFPKSVHHPGEELLAVEGLTVANSEGHTVLEDISFSVRAGEVLGIGGLMGAGRSETLMHVFGAWGKRLSGEIRFKGKAGGFHSPGDAIAGGLVLVSEDRKGLGLHLEQSIGFNMSLSSLKEVSRILIDKHKEVARNQTMFEQLRVKAPGLEVPVGTLSGGNQQKVVIGKALLTEPSVIFLDEPTRGIDVGAKLEVYKLINELCAAGKAVVIVSSEMPELIGMSDRIIMLSEGGIGGRFTREEATQERLLAAAIKRVTASVQPAA